MCTKVNTNVIFQRKGILYILISKRVFFSVQCQHPNRITMKMVSTTYTTVCHVHISASILLSPDVILCG